MDYRLGKVKISDDVRKIKDETIGRWLRYNSECAICGSSFSDDPITYVWESRVIFKIHSECHSEFQKILIQNEENAKNIKVLNIIKKKVDDLVKRYGE